MLYLKACPRCRGDMNTNRDMYGEYRQCLQCGYIRDVEKDNGLLALTANVRSKKKVA